MRGHPPNLAADLTGKRKQTWGRADPSFAQWRRALSSRFKTDAEKRSFRIRIGILFLFSEPREKVRLVFAVDSPTFYCLRTAFLPIPNENNYLFLSSVVVLSIRLKFYILSHPTGDDTK